VESFKQYALKLKATLDELPLDDLKRISEALFQAYREGRMVFVFGNGGSASLASHLACDLAKGTTFLEAQAERAGEIQRFRVLSLTDNVPMISAWANDASYEDVFARQMETFIRPGDVAFGISGSGNSPNVLKALRLAREEQATTVGFTGQGGKMIECLDFAAVVPSTHMQLIEDCHLIMMHMVFLDLRARISNPHSF
jgi:D-sedoheptulose 7-phosphate isomerase